MNIDINKYYDIAYIQEFDHIKELEYPEFIDGWNKCESPKNPKYRAGDVLVIEDDGDIIRHAVVLGCISHSTEELRTDVRGMICFNQIIRRATVQDINLINYGLRYKKIILDLLKVYNVMFNVGKAKYVINTHNGVDTHKDGSKFFGIECFSNKVKFNKKIKQLKAEGYVEK